MKLLNGNVVVGLVEPVRYVPSNGSEFLAFLNDGVEKRDSVQQFREHLLFVGTPFEKRIVFHRIRFIVSEHIRLQARRRLVGHFDAVL